jgi:aspartyl protease family protein
LEEIMGQFSVQVVVAHPADPTRSAEVELLVDTGATLSWVPREVLNRLGLPRLRQCRFVVADGGTIERDAAGAVVRLNGSEAMVTVVAAEPGDSHLLGVTTLETLGFTVDPISQRLIPHELLAV